jgi:hypothetical protein
MALGQVSVNALNLQQAAPTEIEKYFLYIGIGATGVGEIFYLNSQSDLDAELGAADSQIKLNVAAARVNAGSNWNGVVMPVAALADWKTAVDAAMNQNISVEAIVICTPLDSNTGQSYLTAFDAKAVEIKQQYGRRVFFIACAVLEDGGV